MAYEGIDAASLELIIKLQLSDVKRLIKGKGKEGETPDGELAADMYESELESVARCHSDRVMCRNIARAVQLDADIIRHHTELESQAACDRQRILGRGQPTITQDQALPEIDDRVLSRLKAMSLFNDNDESTLVGNSAESSSWAASRPRTSTTPDTPQKCIACGSALATDQAIHRSCSHDYCVECLEGLARAAIADEAFFPPRCCKQPIPIQTTETVLASTIVGELRVKEVEYGTPNRIYCHVPTCSAFITPESIKNDVATCSECSAQTCSICKGSTHTSDCPEDETTQELLRIATENGWQRCRTCHRIVELDFGCNHMSKTRTHVAGPLHRLQPPHHLTSTNGNKPAFVAPSSATSAETRGKTANAPSGTRTTCSRGQTSTSTGTIAVGR